MPELNWKLLTKKRGRSTHGLPPGKEDLAWVVAESGNNIYVTHAHGDHFFVLKLLLGKFPNARAFATASVVARMQKPDKPRLYKILLGAALAWPSSVAVGGAGDSRRRDALS
jgi:glyoxylase-like metal-dependent hydrolase (beta-lactamase superfamily II)